MLMLPKIPLNLTSYTKHILFILITLLSVLTVFTKPFSLFVQATGSPAPDNSNYCENHGGLFQEVDHDIEDWLGCYTWCQSNWSESEPICQYNGDGPRACWINFAPGYEAGISDGNAHDCDWVDVGAMGAVRDDSSGDWTPPGYTINETSPYTTTSDTYSITGTITDLKDDDSPGSIASVKYSVEGTDYENCNITSGILGDSALTFSCNLSNLSAITNISLLIADTPGNETSTSLNIIVSDGEPLGPNPYTNYCYNAQYSFPFWQFSQNFAALPWEERTAETCYSLCPASWTDSVPVCRFNASNRDCSLNSAPQGGLENCIWVTDNTNYDLIKPVSNDQVAPQISIITPIETFSDTVDVGGSATDTINGGGPGVIQNIQFTLVNSGTWSDCQATSGTFGESSSISFVCHLTGLANPVFNNLSNYQFKAIDGENNSNSLTNYPIVVQDVGGSKADHSNYCANSGSYVNEAYDVASWNDCNSWCQSNGSVDNLVCNYFPTQSYCSLHSNPVGGIESCQWASAGLDGGQTSVMGGIIELAPSPTPAPDNSNYCENHGGLFQEVDHDIEDWLGCYTWCQSNWSESEPICQYNGDGPRACWINFAPGYEAGISDGNVNNCNWSNGGPPYGAYFGGPGPETPPQLLITLDNSLADNTVKSTTGFYYFSGNVTDPTNNIASVEYTLDGTNWNSCTCSDESCNSSSESFYCQISGVTGQDSKTISIRATDDADPANTTLEENQPQFTFLPNQNPLDHIIAGFSSINASTLTESVGFLPSYTTSGTPQNSQRLFADDSLAFDGQTKIDYDDPGRTMSFPGPNDIFTVDLWINPSSDIGENNNVIVSKAYTGQFANVKPLWELTLDPTYHVIAALNVQDSFILGTGNSLAVITPGQWTHVIMTWDTAQNSFALHVGNSTPMIMFGSFDNQLPAGDGKLTLGGLTNFGDLYNYHGSISHLNIYNTGDAQAPVITYSLADRERVTTSTPTIQVSLTDATGIDSVEYLFWNSPFLSTLSNVDLLNWTAASLSSGTTAVTLDITPDPPLTDGSWYLYVRATDSNGIKSAYNSNGWLTYYGTSSNSVMGSFRFTVEVTDTTPPDIYAHTIIPNQTTDRNPTIRGFVRDYKYINQGDTASNINHIYYRLNSYPQNYTPPAGDEDGWIEVEPLDGTLNSPSEEFNISLQNLIAGDYTYEIKASDISGNITSVGPKGSLHPNASGSFTILNSFSVPNVESVIREVNFTTRDLSDPIYTTAVWGNGRARLRQTMEFTPTQKLFTNNVDFGYEYGGTYLSLQPSVDSNLWMITNNNDVVYYNKSNDSYTTYPKASTKGSTIRASGVYDFENGNDRFIIITYYGDISSVICSINNTPENTSDDTCYDFSGIPFFTDNGNQHFMPFGTDTRLGHTGLYGYIDNDELNMDKIFLYWDLNGSPTDFTDDTMTTFNRSENLDFRNGNNDPVKDTTVFYFDQSANRIIVGTYTNGVFICTDGGTPNNKVGDQCWSPLPGDISYSHYGIEKDQNGNYWLGGNHGLFFLNINDTNENTDDTLTRLITPADISNEQIAAIKWFQGIDPVGDEIFYVTREGHLRALETNSTPNDTQDDTNYDYQMPFILHRQGNAPAWVMDDRDSFWVSSQARGLYNIDVTRSYESHNIVEFLPSPPQGMLEINNVTLSDVQGTVSAGSEYSFDDLVDYEVSNDDGLTWFPIELGQTKKFENPGYKLKFRINLYKGSTPVLDYVKLGYFAYPDQETRLEVEASTNNPSNNSSSDSSSSSTSPRYCTNQKPSKVPWLYAVLPEGLGKVRLYFTDTSGEYTHYSLQYGKTPNSPEYGSINIGGRGTRNYLVTHLFPGRNYYFQVRADNGCNATEWSNQVALKGPILGGGKLSQKIQSEVIAQDSDLIEQPIESSPSTGDLNDENALPPEQPPTHTYSQTPPKTNLFTGIINFFKSLFRIK